VVVVVDGAVVEVVVADGVPESSEEPQATSAAPAGTTVTTKATVLRVTCDLLMETMVDPSEWTGQRRKSSSWEGERT
jgi:hypothetical protein